MFLDIIPNIILNISPDMNWDIINDIILGMTPDICPDIKIGIFLDNIANFLL